MELHALTLVTPSYALLLCTRDCSFSKGVYFHDTIPQQLVAFVHPKLVPTTLNENTQTCMNNNKSEGLLITLTWQTTFQCYKVCVSFIFIYACNESVSVHILRTCAAVRLSKLYVCRACITDELFEDFTTKISACAQLHTFHSHHLHLHYCSIMIFTHTDLFIIRKPA